MNYVVSSLQRLWRKDTSADRIKRAFENSISFGLFHNGRQIGFVRAVTDGFTVSWVCDLFVDEAYRRMGLGELLMKELLEHPRVKDTRIYLAATQDAIKLYNRMGFSLPQAPVYTR
jgi:GNAT superfamily N-acetyltransferase